MASQNNMSEHAEVRNESHQETFWPSFGMKVSFFFQVLALKLSK